MTKKPHEDPSGRTPEEKEGKIEKPARESAREIPGRSFLESRADLQELEPEVITNENGDPKRALRMKDGKLVYEKKLDYHRDQDEKSGEWKDSSDVKAISERTFEYDDERHPEKPTQENGRHLAREHAWETAYTYDDEGNVMASEGKVTEGEKKGEHWSETVERESIGEFTQVTRVNRSMHPGEEEERLTVKVEIMDAEGKSVYGVMQTAGKPETHQEWGSKPEEVPDVDIEASIERHTAK